METKKRIAVPCSISDHRFVMADKTAAGQALTEALDKRVGAVDIAGELCFEFLPNGQRIKIKISTPCFFKGEYRTRDFTTPGNFEAGNMLLNKLKKQGATESEGKLSFEFIPPKEIQWQCDVCGRNGFLREGTIKEAFFVYVKIEIAHREISPTCNGKIVVVQGVTAE